MSINFICPECGGTQLECCENGPYTSEIVELEENGDFSYGLIEPNGVVERFQCMKCGYILKGIDDIPITTNEEVIEWCKDNCPQE